MRMLNKKNRLQIPEAGQISVISSGIIYFYGKKTPSPNLSDR